jgi:hypothetical protein
MIHYSLVCDEGHEFDGWFRDSAAFDDQAAQGVVGCPVCQSNKVRRAVMAPHIARGCELASDASGSETPESAAPTSDVNVRGDMALMSAQDAQLRDMLGALREKIIASSEDVGEKFPQEARRIQDGDSAPRAIRGRASLAEAKALIEDGIEILPIPGGTVEGN